MSFLSPALNPTLNVFKGVKTSTVRKDDRKTVRSSTRTWPTGGAKQASSQMENGDWSCCKFYKQEQNTTNATENRWIRSAQKEKHHDQQPNFKNWSQLSSWELACVHPV